MRKFITSALAIVAALSLAACSAQAAEQSGQGNQANQAQADQGSQADQGGQTNQGGQNNQTAASESESITISTYNGSKELVDLEVPYNPQRIAILDMAVLDMLDNWNLGDRVVGMPKSSQIDYLMDYNKNEDIVNLGTLKEVDMEALMSSEPDLIFIGGRLASQYDALSEIAPVVYTAVDYEIGLMESVKRNATMIASIFGKEQEAREELAGFDARMEALAQAAEGKTAIIGMVTSSNFNTLGDGSRCSLIGGEVGFENVANDVDSTHGNESSFELLVSLDPDYIFVLDRDSAINAEGAQLAREVMDNELVQKTKAYQNGNIVYLTPTVWYLAEGGITATDVMLQDLEKGVLE